MENTNMTNNKNLKNLPLTNEEAVTYVAAMIEAQNNSFRQIAAHMEEKESQFMTAINELALLVKNDIATKNACSIAIDNLTTSIKAAASSMITKSDLTGCIKTITKSVNNTDVKEKTSGAFDPATFAIASELSYIEKANWRDDIKEKVKKLARANKTTTKEIYNLAYIIMNKLYGVDVYILRNRYANKYSSFLMLISDSDLLMKYCNDAISSIAATNDFKKLKENPAFAAGKSNFDPHHQYTTREVNACPHDVKADARLFYNKEGISGKELADLYNKYDNLYGIDAVIETARQMTGKKKVSKGFAISIAPGALEKFHNMVTSK